MYLYAELWKPRAEWEALPCEQREEYLAKVKLDLDQMKELNVELIGLALCDEKTPGVDAYRYMAVWKMPNLGHVHMLETAVRKEGWQNYFDILSARGRKIPIDVFLKDMVKI